MGTLTVKVAKAGGKSKHASIMPTRRGNSLDYGTVTTSGTSAKATASLNAADAENDMIYTLSTDTDVYIKVGQDSGLVATSNDYPLLATDNPLEIALEVGENVAVIDQ